MNANQRILSDKGKILVIGVSPANDVREMYANRTVYVDPAKINSQHDIPAGIEIVLHGNLGKRQRQILDGAHARKIQLIIGKQTPDTLFKQLDKLTQGVDLNVDPFPASGNDQSLQDQNLERVDPAPEPPVQLPPPAPKPPKEMPVPPAHESALQERTSIEERACTLIRRLVHLPVESCSAEATRLLPTVQAQISSTMSHATLTRLISRVNNERQESSPVPRVVHSPTPLLVASLSPAAPARKPDPPTVRMHKPGQGELKAFILKHRDPNAPNTTAEAERLLVEAGTNYIETTRNSIRQTLYALAKEGVKDTSKAAPDKTRANPPAPAPGKPARKARPEPESAKPEPSSLSILVQEVHALLKRQDQERTTLAVRHTEENSALILRQLQEQRKLFFGDAE